MRNKKRIVSAVATLAIGLSLATSAASARDLIYGSWLSAKHGINVYAVPPFIEGISKDTNGEVTWKLLPGGSLVSGRTTLSGIRDGIIDAGIVIPSYTAKELPGNTLIMGVQVFGEDTMAASAAAIETVLLNCPQCLKDFEEQNAVYLAGHAAAPFYMMCKGPVEKLDDLKGKKVQASGSGSRMVQALGGIPTPMSPAEGLTAMQRGAIDCVYGAIGWLSSYSFNDVVTHVLDYPLGIVGALGTYTVNRDIWNGFTAEQKKAHFDNIAEFDARAVIDAYVTEEAKVRKESEEMGITFVKPDPAEFEAVVADFQANQREELITKAKEFGVENPEVILDRFNENLKKWQALTPEMGTDVEKYTAAIKREIYDKLDPTNY